MRGPRVKRVPCVLERSLLPRELEIVLGHHGDERPRTRRAAPAERLRALLESPCRCRPRPDEIARVDLDVLAASRARRAETPPRANSRTESTLRWRRRSRRARPAGASATSPRRSRPRSPSRASRPGCRGRASLQPGLMRAAARVILRVTKVSPRRGDSWLKRMPLRDEHPVRLAVVHGIPVGDDLVRGVGAARLERGRLVLRRRRRAEHLATTRPGRSAPCAVCRWRRASPPAGAACRCASTSAVYSGSSKDTRTWRLRAQVVDLVGHGFLEHAAQPCRRRDRRNEATGGARLVRVLVDVVEAFRVERARAADHAVDLVALREQQLGQVGAVLPGDAGDERALHGTSS